MEIQLPINERGRGFYSKWIIVESEDECSLDVSSALDDHCAVCITKRDAGEDVSQQWYLTLRYLILSLYWIGYIH